VVVVGLAASVDGGLKMWKSKGLVRHAAQAHTAALAEFRAVESRAQFRAAAYGQKQLQTQTATLGAWVDWLEANEKKVRRIGRPTVDGIAVEAPNIPALKARVFEGINLLKGGARAAAGAYVAQQAALWGVTSFAAASTGASIAGLSGAAATNATLAWLGGGTLATGGGGVALGGIMLTGIAVAPAALVGGFAIGVQGQRSLTKAQDIVASVDKSLAEMSGKQLLLGQVESRIGELEDVLDDVNTRALANLEALNLLDFDPEAHLAEFQRTALLMRALGEILSTPIVDINGKPTEQSLRVKERYSE
jgi:hypothetical protein